jgi:molybdenum cofactor sulfurtransferase
MSNPQNIGCEKNEPKLHFSLCFLPSYSFIPSPPYYILTMQYLRHWSQPIATAAIIGAGLYTLYRFRRSHPDFHTPSPPTTQATIAVEDAVDDAKSLCESTPVDEEYERLLSEFLSDDISDGYGYDHMIDALLKRDFHRLDAGQCVYLDHAGAALYPESLVTTVTHDWTSTVYANPHSRSDQSIQTAHQIEHARECVLEWLHAPADEYDVIFTSGATSAIKLVTEAFPFSSRSMFAYTTDNHTSILGMRQTACEAGAGVLAVDARTMETFRRVCEPRDDVDSDVDSEAPPAHSLFCFPGESNFSGDRYSLSTVHKCRYGELPFQDHKKRRWWVLLDAAKLVSAAPPDLSVIKPAFMCVSFYKVFGFPTGLGALIVRKEAGKILNRKYFGGGTVEAVAADTLFHSRRRDITGQFEDGTAPFLQITSLVRCFDYMKQLTFHRIQLHTTSLTQYIWRAMRAFKHNNGTPVVEMYSTASGWGEVAVANSSTNFVCGQGPTLTFNFLHADGSYVGYAEVDQLASVRNIQLRTGCFCNTGSCQRVLSMSSEQIEYNLKQGHVCWDDNDLVNGKPTGAVRISFGFSSSFRDAYRWLSFIQAHFIEATTTVAMPDTIPSKTHAVRTHTAAHDSTVCPVISRLRLYPIKSCAGVEVKEWPVGPSGLLCDREWAIVNMKGTALNQKRFPSMCLIRPELDFQQQQLTLHFPDTLSLTVPFDGDEQIDGSPSALRVCGSNCFGTVYASTREWLSTVIGTSCVLARQSSASKRVVKNRSRLTASDNAIDAVTVTTEQPLSFANEAHYLMVNESTCRAIVEEEQQVSNSKESVVYDVNFLDPVVDRFRPNIIVSGWQPFAETELGAASGTQISVGPAGMNVIGPCVRCKMINVDQRTGDTSVPLLPLLVRRCRTDGKLVFGTLLCNTPSLSSAVLAGDEVILRVGDELGWRSGGM